LIIKIIKEHGAIPFVISTAPQLLLINETNSNIFGRAKNPWDTRRSPGGSSGGESGLISLGCSPGGIGSDGAGSIRIPALSTGIYGFKPSKDRWPMTGHKKVGGYGNHFLSVTGGPLAQSVDDLQLFLGATLNDSAIRKNNQCEGHPRIEWSDEKVETYKKSIKKFAYLPQMDVFPAGPANTRA